MLIFSNIKTLLLTMYFIHSGQKNINRIYIITDTIMEIEKFKTLI